MGQLRPAEKWRPTSLLSSHAGHRLPVLSSFHLTDVLFHATFPSLVMSPASSSSVLQDPVLKSVLTPFPPWRWAQGSACPPGPLSRSRSHPGQFSPLPLEFSQERFKLDSSDGRQLWLGGSSSGLEEEEEAEGPLLAPMAPDLGVQDDRREVFLLARWLPLLINPRL